MPVYRNPVTQPVATSTATQLVVFPFRWVYPSQFRILQSAGVRAVTKKAGGAAPADRWGYTDQGEYGFYVSFPDAADLAKASATGAVMFTSRPHGDSNWWIINTDIGVLQAAGAPFTITTQGRVFSKLLLHEYEIWQGLYNKLTLHIQQQFKVDPNQFADPNISLPNVMPEAAPIAPEKPAAPATELPPISLPYSEAAQEAVQPSEPVTYYPSPAFDVPQLAPAATPAPAASAAPAVLGVGALLWLLLRK